MNPEHWPFAVRAGIYFIAMIVGYALWDFTKWRFRTWRENRKWR